MPRPRLAVVALVISSAIYLTGFASDHSEALAGNGALTMLWIWSPFAIVFATARLWPRWWLVPAVFVAFYAIPVAVDAFEQRTGLYPVGTTAASYEMGGLDNLTTSFLTIFAYPATVLAVISVFIMRRVR